MKKNVNKTKKLNVYKKVIEILGLGLVPLVCPDHQLYCKCIDEKLHFFYKSIISELRSSHNIILLDIEQKMNGSYACNVISHKIKKNCEE